MNDFSLMKNALLFNAVLLIISCGSPSKEAQEQPADTSSALSYLPKSPGDEIVDTEADFTTTFWGTLHCEDCSGIETTLEISRDFQRFRLHEKKQGSDAVRTTEGNLNTERGFGDDADATVYVLNHDKAESEQRCFVRYTGNDNEVKALGRERKELPKQNTLRRVE